MSKIKNVAKGFTLIELLVVVLIIGILSAIALPMYRQAVEKSRVSDALTTMQAVSRSEHNWYLTNNNYTKDFGNLDIDLTDANGNKADNASFETTNYTFTLQDTSIKAERNNGEYTLYKSYEDGNIYCSPEDNYVCEQYFGVNGNVCTNKLSGVWHTASSYCYGSAQERCEQEYNAWRGSYCGYSASEQTLYEGMECRSGSGWHGCNYSSIAAGGKCIASGSRSCNNAYINGGECTGSGSQPCWDSTITAGGVCSANDSTAAYPSGCNNATIYNGECSGACNGAKVYAGGTCSGICGGVKVYAGGVCSGGCGWNSATGTTQIYAGGKCISSATNSCKNANYPTDSETGLRGCCCGNYCGTAPKCDDSVCDKL